MAVIKELDLGGFSDATHALGSPVRSLDRSCHVVVLLGESDRSGTVRFLSSFLYLCSLFTSTQWCSLSIYEEQLQLTVQ